MSKLDKRILKFLKKDVKDSIPIGKEENKELSIHSDSEIKLEFTNPITKKQDHVIVKALELQQIKSESSHSVGHMWNISFFQQIDEKVYIVNLYLDNKNKVRSVSKGNFFLKIKDRLYR